MASCPIHTHGGTFDVLNPDPELIRIEDIAWALSHQCRFNGHTVRPYSVGEHCLYVCRLVLHRTGDPLLALAALLHDATEAYLPDVISPLKPLLTGFKELEDNLGRVIAEKFGLPWPEPAEVKEADLAVLAAERDQVISETDRSAWRELPPPAEGKIREMSPAEVREEFLGLFRYLAARVAADQDAAWEWCGRSPAEMLEIGLGLVADDDCGPGAA